MKALRSGFAFLVLVLAICVPGWSQDEIEEPPVYQSLKGNLVAVQGGELKPFDDAALLPTKHYLIYFASGSDGACRRFSENLLRIHEKLRAARAPVELILVPWEESQEEMERNLIETKIPWPVVSWQAAQTHSLLNHSGKNIPALVLLDDRGEVLSTSFDGQLYRGPATVLEDVARRFNIPDLLAPAPAPAPATGSASPSTPGPTVSPTPPGKNTEFDSFFRKKASPSPK